MTQDQLIDRLRGNIASLEALLGLMESSQLKVFSNQSDVTASAVEMYNGIISNLNQLIDAVGRDPA